MVKALTHVKKEKKKIEFSRNGMCVGFKVSKFNGKIGPQPESRSEGRP